MSTSPSPTRVKDTRPRGSDADGKNIPFQVACARCKRGKKKCNNMLPCKKCADAGVECVYTAHEKKRPVSREVVTALELLLEARNTQIEELQGQIEALRGIVNWWEWFVGDLAQNGSEYRDLMLAGFRPGGGVDANTGPIPPPQSPPPPALSPRIGNIKVHAAHPGPRTKPSGNGAGPAAVMAPVGPVGVPAPAASGAGPVAVTRGGGLSILLGPTSSQIANGAAYIKPPHQPPFSLNNDGHALLAPQGEDCKRLMSLFFLRLYPYHMHFYREFFLRDLHAGGGPYYSDLLMYAICSVAALVSKDPAERQRSELFARRAQGLLYDSGMDSPDITVLQALLLLSQREIGQGNGTKAWMFAGMAFRLAHEMGLHLDPDNFESGTSETADIEREIRRRCYWGAFCIDKWTSLYFGRPPALSPRESDVRETKRIQYPAWWSTWASSTLDPSMIRDDLFSGKKTPQDEDGAALIGTLLCGIDLTKIVHKMLTNVFEIRSQKDPASMAAATTEIHLELTRWLNSLPRKVHWNEWSSDVEPYVLVLHMMYHTVLITLHRPPLPASTTSPDFTLCWHSVTSIVKLIRQYTRGNNPLYLPVTFIHTCTAAASIILMRRHILAPDDVVNNEDEDEAAKYLMVILDALEGCGTSWAAAMQAKQAILVADEEARRRRDEMVNAQSGAPAARWQQWGQDEVMGGMGGVAGFLDLEYWEEGMQE